MHRLAGSRFAHAAAVSTDRVDERTRDHVTISRTRRLIGAEAHQQVFAWVLKRLARGGLLKGKTIGIDSTTLEANAVMKSIVRRDSQ
jgi:transposase